MVILADIKMEIYNQAPIWFQNILTTFQGLIYKNQRYGTHYFTYLNELKERDYSNLNEQEKLQNLRLVQLVQHAVNNSPFYKKYYESLDLNDINTVEDIDKIPILPKEVVRENIDLFYTIFENDGIVSNTSGTTGTSLKFIYSYEDFQKRLAYLDHFKAQHGFIAFEMKRASFSTAKVVPPNQKSKVFWRNNFFLKQRIYSGYHCKGENIKLYIDDLNRYKPDSLDGLPSSLYELARYIIDNNIKLTFTPIAIFPTAETLLPHYRLAIEKAFKCPVRDQYASSEGAPFITECKFGSLHYNMDTGIIEVDDNGEMIVTCFETYGTPLIRYKIGDKAVISEEKTKCKCGSIHPIIKGIEGRSLDYLVSRSNGKFTAIFLSLVSQDFNNSVKRMQFIQNSIERIDILLEVDKNYEQHSMNQIILEKLRYSFGEDMIFNISVVDEIPKEPSGKFRLIKNNLKQ
jgi:phenylacetate-CoA ligase